MPFTPAHTVAVLPFLRKDKLSATALVAGSMSPDFEYFIRMNVMGIWGHDLPGIFLFDLPMTITMVVVFHMVVKTNLIDNLPVFLQRKFSHLKMLTLKEDFADRPVTFILCACAGALTHVVWDGFTHARGFFVQNMRWLYDGAYVPYDGVKYPLWYSLQYISSIVGMLILITWILFTSPRRQGPLARPGFLYWALLPVIAGIVVAVRLQFLHRTSEDLYAVTAISGICIAVIVLGFLPARKELAEVPKS